MKIKIQKKWSPISFYTKKGRIDISVPEPSDVSELIALIKSEDLDLRRLTPISKDAYSSMGKEKLMFLWKKEKNDLAKLVNDKLSPKVARQVIIQGEGIIKSGRKIPGLGTIISDPFNMASVENSALIENLLMLQLPHILIAKHNKNIIGTIRVLEVEGSVEIVSLVVRKDYRKNGIARQLIRELIKRVDNRPLFLFQEPKSLLLRFYLGEFSKEQAYIPPFEELPKALKRDLLYMNAFWGPYVVIKIPGKLLTNP
ncbi:MAG TPA: GNAT family N-acetyltransferase [Candidatus Bathyarchaeia archaeon]|nr:GNAT family N-acetyltransferase [Candidatus Bathyarchaeia archaeon]